MKKEFSFRRVTSTGRQRAIKIEGVDFKGALSKGLALHGHLKYNLPHEYKPQKKMDLATAIQRAAKASKDTGKSYYVIADDKNGECSVNTAPIGSPIHKFKNGKEDMAFTRSHAKPEEKETKKATKTIVSHEDFKTIKQFKNKQTQITMSTATKTKAAAKKVAAKKAAPAKKEKQVRAKYTDGKKVTMTNKEMTAKIKKGYSYFNEKGVNKTNYIPERPNQELVNKGYYEVAPN